MFRLLVIAVLAFAGTELVSAGGPVVTSTTPQCVTDKGGEFNQMVMGLKLAVESNLPQNPTVDLIHAILNMTCNDPTTRRAVDDIAKLIAECLYLVNETSITDMKIGELSFTDLFEKFAGVQHFCDCVPSLVAAMKLPQENVMTMVASTYQNKKVVKFSAMCMENPVNVSMALKTLRDHVRTCERVFDYTPLFHKRNIIQAAALTDLCTNEVLDNYDCVETGTVDPVYKSCISQANVTRSTSDSKLCLRNKCVDALTTCRADVRKAYMWSVEVANQGTFDLSDDCNGGTSAVITFALLVSASLIAIFFQY